jgi:hypothetical protein
LNIAETAKQEDKLKHYQAALDLYTDVLERFMLILQSMRHTTRSIACKCPTDVRLEHSSVLTDHARVGAGETNPGIRTSLRETMTAYMSRAEQIKDVCKITPHRVSDYVPAASVAAARRRSTVLEGSGGAAGLSRASSMFEVGSMGRGAPMQQAPPAQQQQQQQLQPLMGTPLTNNPNAASPWGTDAEQFDPNPLIPRMLFAYATRLCVTTFETDIIDRCTC